MKIIVVCIAIALVTFALWKVFSGIGDTMGAVGKVAKVAAEIASKVLEIGEGIIDRLGAAYRWVASAFGNFGSWLKGLFDW